MSQSIQSGKTSVTGSVTTTIQSMVGSQITTLAGVNTNASTPTTLGTVGAGKAWRIYGYTLGVSAPNAAFNDRALLQAGAVVIGSIQYSGATGQYPHPYVSVSFGQNYILAAAGTAITLLSADGNATACATVYYEEITV